MKTDLAMPGIAVRTAAAFFCIAMLAGAPAHAQDYTAIVASPDRSDADRNNDKKRKPEQILAFTGVKTGMKVMDLVSSAGYSAELLARSVGPNGTVYAVNSKETAERVKDRFEPRIGKMKSLVSVVREYADPVPPEVSNLDLVTIYFSYHDLVHMGVDRAAMPHRAQGIDRRLDHLAPRLAVDCGHEPDPARGVLVGRIVQAMACQMSRVSLVVRDKPLRCRCLLGCHRAAPQDAKASAGALACRCA